MFKYIIKNITHNFTKNLLCLTAIIFSVSLMMGILILQSTVSNKLNSALGYSKNITAIKVYNNGVFSDSEINFIKTLKEVTNINKTYQHSFSTAINNKEVDIELNGIQLSNPSQRQYIIVEGRDLEENNFKSRELIMNYKSAQKLSLSINDEISVETVNTSRKYKIVGFFDNEAVVFKSHLNEVIVPDQVIQKDMGIGNRYNIIDLSLINLDFKTINDVKKKIEAKYKSDLYLHDIYNDMAAAKEDINSLLLGLTVILLILILTGVFLIYNTFNLQVKERTAIIGLFRTIGSNKRQVKEMIFVESTIFGVMGTILGIIIGVTLGILLIYLYVDSPYRYIKNYFNVPFSSIIFSIIVGMGSTFAGAFIPAKKAAGISPLSTLRYSAEDNISQYSSKILNKFVTGIFVICSVFIVSTVIFNGIGKTTNAYLIMLILLVLFIVGVILAIPYIIYKYTNVISKISKKWFDINAYLAARNLTRNINKTTVIVSVMTIGVMIVIGFNGIFNSFRESVAQFVSQTYNYDYMIEGSFDKLGSLNSIIKKLKSSGTVSKYTTMRVENFTDEDNDVNTRVFGIDPEEYMEFTKMEFTKGNQEEAFNSLKLENTCIIGAQIAKEHNLSLDDNFFIKIKNKSYPYKIVGIVNSFTQNGRVAFVNKNSINRIYKNDKITTLCIMLNGKDSDGEFIKLSDKLFPHKLVSVFSLTDLKKEWRDEIIKGTEIFDSMYVAIFLFIIFSLINTIVLSIYDRNKEIGMIMSIGANRKQIRKIFSYEIILLYIVSIIISIFTSYIFILVALKGLAGATGMPVHSWYPMGTMVLVMLLLLVTCTCIGMYMVSRVSKMNKVALIKYN